MTSRLTLAETIDAARQQGAIDEIVQKTLAMSDEEIARELEADGVDVGVLDARLAARARELGGAAPKASASLPQAGRREHSTKKIAAGFGAGVAATGAVLAALARGGVVAITASAPTIPTTASSPPNVDHATELRKAAFEACGRGRWQECIAGFDEAKAIDPSGDADPEVQAARKRATTSLR